MVRLPVLTELRVTEYELFPGQPTGAGIEWSFEQGVTVVAGINGLGKTTLLLMILRSLTGRYDLTADGASQSLSVVLPRRPVRLNARQLGVFRRRVSDGAVNARVALSARIGERTVNITRRLDNLVLESLKIDEELVDLPAGMDAREGVFQWRLTELIGLGSFVDVLLVLHHVMLFLENRPGALWDSNAQRQLLRALCLDSEDAGCVAELERQLQRTDSRARNVHARITTTDRRLVEAAQEEAGAAGVRAELAGEQELLDADLQEAERLEGVLEELDEERKRARLGYERAKIVREEADGAVERVKYMSLLTHFPTMHDAIGVVLARIMKDGRCRVCDAPAEGRQAELKEQVERGCCPICGADVETGETVVGHREFDRARLERDREHAEEARREEEAQRLELEDFAGRHKEALSQWERIRQSIEVRTEMSRQLRARLPDTVTSREYRSELEILRREHRELQARRESVLEELRALLESRRDAITASSEELKEGFGELVDALLVDEVRLVQQYVAPEYLEAPGPLDERVQVPGYVAEMKAAVRPEFSRRKQPEEVSESQRELIDLAFRLALVRVFGGASTFAMETPEASLDGIAMERVGRALAEFASRDGNRLVVTSNLTNRGIVKAMFDATQPEAGTGVRLNRVLNLLEVAAPNRALTRDLDGYRALVEEMVSGATA